MSGLVYVVDDDSSLRRGLSRLLRSAGYEVEAFASAREFLNAGRPKSPSCLILDVMMPGRSGLELQEDLRDVSLTLPIIFLSAHSSVPVTVRALKGGAFEFLEKPVEDVRLLAVVGAAIEHHSRILEDQSERSEIVQRHQSLTPRERQIMALVVEGLRNKQIANQLAISEPTVKVHRGRVMSKMKAGSVVELVRLFALV